MFYEGINLNIVSDIRKASVVTHKGHFSASEIVATVILSKALNKIFLCRSNSNNYPDSNSSTLIIIDSNFTSTEGNIKKRDNNIAYGCAGIIWKEYGPKILSESCNSNFVFNYIDSTLIQTLDSFEQNHFIDCPLPCDINMIIENFNNLRDKDSNDWAFIEAANFADTIFSNFLINAENIAKQLNVLSEDPSAFRKLLLKADNGLLILENFLPIERLIKKSTLPLAKELIFLIYPYSNGFIISNLRENSFTFCNTLKLAVTYAKCKKVDYLVP